MRDLGRRSIGYVDASVSRSSADDDSTETSNLSIAGLVGWEVGSISQMLVMM